MSTFGIAAASVSLTAIVGFGLAAPGGGKRQLDRRHHRPARSAGPPRSAQRLDGRAAVTVQGHRHERLNNSNLDESGNKIDPDLHNTVYVDVVCHNH